MGYKDKTKEQLIAELAKIRQRLAELEASEAECQRAGEKLREGMERYQAILEGIEDGYFEADVAGNFTFFNNSLRVNLGYSKDEVMGMNNRQYMDEENARKVYQTFNRVYCTGKTAKAFDWEIIRKDGSKRFVEASISLIRDPSGQPTGFRGIARDITERKQVHEITRRLGTCETEDEVYRLIVEIAEKALAFSMCTLDIVEENRLVVKAISSGLPPEASVGRALDEGGLAAKTYHTGETIVFGSLEEVPEARPTRGDFRSGISAPIGDIGVFQVVSTEVDAFTGDDVRLLDLLLGHTAEAIKRIRLQNELKRQALHDPLTDVHNRRYFTEAIVHEIARSKRYDRSISFLMVDINRFKEINDRFGHLVGDRVLQMMGKLLQEQVRQSDVVVRYGGDEFLIILLETNNDAEAVKERILAAVTVWNEKNELLLGFPLTLSIGSAYWRPRVAESVENVLAKADRRMYEDKRRQQADRDGPEGI